MRKLRNFQVKARDLKSTKPNQVTHYEKLLNSKTPLTSLKLCKHFLKERTIKTRKRT
ncbi:hypothetical protein C1H46_037506 [Malus baccata]|uniref:Uncharacterized protein n=1 Tax=Malus baccata TaxID=106549 RepID=A0A540KRX5_MALBA|nr:hypothetical protein C1H46_037506 [Malus baccata]